MIYKLSSSNTEKLLLMPETGMGYQVVNGYEQHYFQKTFLILNGQFAIDIQDKNYHEIFNTHFGKDLEGDLSRAKQINLTITDTASGEKRIGSFVSEAGYGKNIGAKDAEKEKVNGDELFVRLSYFENDIRIDKENKCLRPGSYTTTAADALICKTDNDDPVQRYALPNELEIKWAFYIQPQVKDELQRGWVQPQNGKRGGGREVYFEKGTSIRTFIAQTKW